MINFYGKQTLRKFVLRRASVRPHCVYVLSTGRVGTDALTQLLSLSPKIRATHEPSPKFLDESKQAYQNATISLDLARHFVNTRFFLSSDHSMRQCLLQRKIYVETSNRMTYLAPSIAEYLPTSQFIFLHRAPWDVIRSGMRRKFYDGNGWDPHRIIPRDSDHFSSNWESWGPFEKCCWYWRTVNQFSHDFISSMTPKRSFTLRSESIFGKDIGALRDLFRWLRVPAPTERSINDALSVRHNRQESGSFPLYANWTPGQKEKMRNIVQPISKALGYNID